MEKKIETTVIGFRVMLGLYSRTLQCSSFFGFGMVFWLGLLLGLPDYQKDITSEGLGRAY